MVFLADLDGDEYLLTYGLFGVQHETLTPEKRNNISNLYSLLAKSAGRVDHLQDQSHGLPRDGPKSTTFVAYCRYCGAQHFHFEPLSGVVALEICLGRQHFE